VNVETDGVTDIVDGTGDEHALARETSGHVARPQLRAGAQGSLTPRLT